MEVWLTAKLLSLGKHSFFNAIERQYNRLGLPKFEKRYRATSQQGDLRLSGSSQAGLELAIEGFLQISGRIRYQLCHRCSLQNHWKKIPERKISSNKIDESIASPKQDDFRLSGPPSGQGVCGGARTRNRRIPVDLRADLPATVPLKRKHGEKNMLKYKTL
ncbi:hypothetical protein PoB_007235700 [Plakobranchus ocellatus]|uniref:Uncharacterized protein n=1 Tax=Plakobranchus ocellatus TaxID=259542 RepID=A0AAV4DNI7_9GAST|nr:hypothetical protein PoB_007235700 [Plakobranchus ocellatus]